MAVAIARLKLPGLPRFLKWGRPIERLVAPDVVPKYLGVAASLELSTAAAALAGFHKSVSRR